jgi:hypothetical protein
MSHESHPTNAYVSTALELHGLQVDPARQAAVEQQFQVLAAMAQLFLREPLPPETEPATIFRL